MSRQQFIKTAAGATGILLGAGVFFPTALQAQTNVARPRPIPGGIRPFGPGTPFIHVFPPGPGFEPSTITDFKGLVGVAVVQGMGKGIDTDTGTTTRLFYEVDNRFMDGLYVGLDGRRHRGAFAFIWLDLFEGPGGPQIHDFNPGIAPSGLFWTVPIPRDHVRVDLDSGRALMYVTERALRDDFTFENSVLHNGPRPVRATASFIMKWFAVKRRFRMRDAANDFAGQFVETDASIFWSAKEEGFTFVSDPPDKSKAVFAILGRERNGVYFP